VATQAPRIERAGPLHAATLAAIHAASFPPAEQWTEDALAALLALPGSFGLIDPEGGFILARVAADEAEILTLAVSPLLRRQGRARILLTYAVRLAEAAGATALFLEVSDANLAARALYADAGFRTVGRRRAYYASGETALVLRLDIRPCAASGA
jgi:ribosomal-protein-alanine N-acetyltransferase